MTASPDLRICGNVVLTHLKILFPLSAHGYIADGASHGFFQVTDVIQSLPRQLFRAAAAGEIGFPAGQIVINRFGESQPRPDGEFLRLFSFYLLGYANWNVIQIGQHF